MIDGILLQATVTDILLELRYQLQINGIFLFSAMKDCNDDIMVSCPMHKGGQEHKPSCGINKKTGVVHCFTCGYAVTLSEMISNVFGYNDYGLFGKSWLKKNFTEIAVEERDDITLDMSRTKTEEEHTIITSEDYDKYRYTHPYMYKRGLTDDVIERYDIGYDAETNDIIFPCRDVFGDISYFIRRSVDNKRFNYQRNTKKSIYGIYEFYKYFSDFNELYVCESCFNTCSCVVCGVPAISLNGTGSKEQIAELANLPVRSLVLALDPDEAGRKGIDRIVKEIYGKKLLYTLDYVDGRDLNDLLLEGELAQTLERKIFVQPT